MVPPATQETGSPDRVRRVRLFTAIAIICFFCLPAAWAFNGGLPSFDANADTASRTIYQTIIVLTLIVGGSCALQIKKLISEVSRLESKINKLEEIKDAQWKRIDKQSLAIHKHQATLQNMYDGILNICLLHEQDAPKELITMMLESLKDRMKGHAERDKEIQAVTPPEGNQVPF